MTRSVESLSRGEEVAETPSSMSNTEDESDSVSESEREDAPIVALTVQRQKRHSPLQPPAQREALNCLNPLSKDGSPKPVTPPVPPKAQLCTHSGRTAHERQLEGLFETLHVLLARHMST